jgi:hypothetical protein
MRGSELSECIDSAILCAPTAVLYYFTGCSAARLACDRRLLSDKSTRAKELG